MLGQSGYSSTVDALKLAKAYDQEDNFIVWAEIASDLKTINNLIAGLSFHDQYKVFCRNIFKSIAAKIGWNKEPQESHSRTLLRGVVLYAYGANGDKNTIRKAREIFKDIIIGKSKIDADLRGVVYNLVAENGGEKEYSILKDLYRKISFQEEKDRIFKALCLFKDVKFLKETLTFAFSENMRAQDRFRGISYVWGNPAGRNLAWNFLQENWKSIQQAFAGGHLYPRFIQPASYFVDGKRALEIEEFFKKNPSNGLERTIAQVTEQIRANDLWLKRDKSKISSFLRRVNNLK
jgi:puromycin-sensitive aminopeptidase